MVDERLLKKKDEIWEDIKYDYRFTGVGVSKNKIIVYASKEHSVIKPFSADVVVTKANFKSMSYDILRNKFRPVIGGISIGAINGLTGTLGAVIGDYGVSASHVVSSNPTGKSNGDIVIQPGAVDGGNYTDIIGETVYHKILNKETDGDFGIFEINTAKRNEVIGFGSLNKVGYPKVGKSVVKIGRTTGITKGNIISTHTNAKVYYPELGKEIMLTNQFVVSGNKFSMPGDSGASIIFGNMYVGLVAAGDDTHTLATPFVEVINKLNEVRRK